MSDIKIIIGADIKELDQKLSIAKAKLSSLGQEGPRALAPLQQRLSGLTFPTEKVSQFGNKFAGLASIFKASGLQIAAVTAVIGVATAATSKVLQIIFKEWINTGKAAEEAAQKSAKAIKDYNDLVQSSISSTAKESTEVLSLISILKSETETRERKLGAIKELQKIQPQVFNDLKLEGEKVLGLDAAYKAYAANLTSIINLKILQGRAESAITRQLELQRLKEQGALDIKIQPTKDLTAVSLEAAKAQRELATQAFNTRKILGQNITGAQAADELERVNKLIEDLSKQIVDLSKNIKVNEVKIIPKKIKIGKPEKIEVEKIPDFYYDIPEPIKRITGAGLTPTLVLKPKLEVEVSPEEQQKVLDKTFGFFDKEKLAVFQKQATDAINNTIGNIASDSISMAAEAIGEAIAGNADALPNLFDALVKSIGGQVKELGKYLVQLGVQMIVAKKAAENLSFNPYTAIAAGAALQILGSVLTASFNKKANKGFATGVRDLQEGGVYSVGERGPETIYLPRGSSVRPNNEVNAYGGGSQVFIPAVSLRGSDLVIAFNRASQSMSRNS